MATTTDTTQELTGLVQRALEAIAAHAPAIAAQVEERLQANPPQQAPRGTRWDRINLWREVALEVLPPWTREGSLRSLVDVAAHHYGEATTPKGCSCECQACSCCCYAN